MKKLSFFISLFCLLQTLTIQPIEVKTESGVVTEVDENETVANFFKKCRQTQRCTTQEDLVLQFFNTNRVRENSELASLPLKKFIYPKNTSNQNNSSIDAYISRKDTDTHLVLGGLFCGYVLGSGITALIISALLIK